MAERRAFFAWWNGKKVATIERPAPLRQAATDDAPAVTVALPREKARSPFLKTFSAFQHTGFRYLWFGNLFGSGAMWIQQITLSWLIYELTGSAVMLGLINGVRTIPFALTAPFSGTLADRMDRRKLMLGTQVFLAVIATLFAVDVALGYVEVWHVFAFTLLIGFGTGFNNTTRQAIVPGTVPRGDLVNAMALANTSMNVTRTFGPAVGGILIGLIGMAGNFFIQAGCYAGAFLSIFPIKIRQDASGAKRTREPFSKTMVDGFRYIVSNKPVFSLILLGLVPMLVLFPVNALMPIFAKEYFGMGATGFGVLLTAAGIGSLIGTLGVATFADMKRKAPVFYTLLPIAIATVIAFAWTRSLALALFVLGVQGAMQMAYFSLNGATLQLLVPDTMRGRVMAVYMLDTAMIPLGGLVGGLLAEFFGAPMALTIMGLAGFVFVGAAFFLLPEVRRL